jgi:Tol biopolymer transport system component
MRRATQALVVASVLAAMPAPTTAVAASDSCPNAALRTGASARLPDCRAYELVTPSDKVFGVGEMAVAAGAAAGGDHFAFSNSQALTDLNQAWPADYRADRSEGGWTAVAPDPRPFFDSGATLVAMTNDLSLLEVTPRAYSAADQDFQGPGASNDLYRIGSAGQVSFLSDGELNPVNIFAQLNVWAATADGSHVVFSYDDPLLAADAGRQSAPGLYESSPSGLRLVGVDDAGVRLTDGTVDLGSVGSASDMISALHAVSADGSKIFFAAYDGGAVSGKAGLYVRENGEHTMAIPATPDGANARATFLGASADGSTVYFLTTDGLTTTDADGAQDLYAYDLSTQTTTLVSDGTGSGTPLFSAVYANDDGSRVYFQVYGQLEPGVGADNQVNTYVSQNGSIALVAATGAVNVSGFARQEQCSPTRLTPDGRYLLFESSDQLTSDDHDFSSDVYRYDAKTGQLDRVSQGPQGGNAETGAYNNAQIAGGINCNDSYLDASHAISDDGHFVFFQTTEQLVAADTNQEFDVYEYDAQTGETRLVSGGYGPDDSQLMTVTPSGNEVFISTTDQLVASDHDALRDVYAVRVNGGFPDVPGQPSCRESDCQGAPRVVEEPPVIASITFTGPGNATATRKPSRATARVRVLKRFVRGTRISLRVKVPGRGRISVAGTALKRATKTVSRAATYSVSAHLTAKAADALRRKHRLRLKVRVGYIPSAGKASSVTVTIQVRK